MKILLSEEKITAFQQLCELDYKETARLLRKYKWAELKKIASEHAGKEIEF